MNKLKFELPIYGQKFVIVKGNMTEIFKHYKLSELKNGIEYDACCFNKDGIIYIAFENDTPGNIAHECLHGVRMMYENFGIELVTNDNDENQCYLLGYIVDKCHSFLSK